MYFRVKGPHLLVYISEKEEYTEESTRACVKQLMSVTNWLHQRHIAHLDLKVIYPCVLDGKSFEACFFFSPKTY